MTGKEKDAIETMQHWIDYEKANKEKINKADELIEIQETVLNLIQTQQEEIEKLKKTELKTKGGGVKVTLEGLICLETKILDLETELNKKDTLINTMKAEYERLEDLEDNTDMLKEELKKKNSKIALLEKLYENLQKDFDSFKKDEDIHYLDGIHHKQLVEKSVGQKIDKPEECWFDIFEVKLIKNEMLYGITIKEDFINLKQIADTDPENCMTVIAEGPLSGAIYRYNNYGDKEWYLIGTMMGYA